MTEAEPKYRPKQVTFVPPKRLNHYIPTLEDRKLREEQLREYLKTKGVTKLPNRMVPGARWAEED